MPRTPDRPPGTPILIELVGPPGAGKSTIFRELMQRDDRIHPNPVPSKRSFLGPLGWHVLAMLATAVRHGIVWRFNGAAWRALAYLRALPRILEGLPSEYVIVFDQGPIFQLTRPAASQRRIRPWRARMFAKWNVLLDVVVVLDAPDDVLIDRINTRGKPHRVKGWPSRNAIDFVARSRAVYDEALADLTDDFGPTILRFDTSRHSAAEVVDEIVTALALVRGVESAPSSGAQGTMAS